MKNKKKGSIFDGITFFIILFAFAIFFITVYKILGDVNDDIQADADFNSEGAALIDGYHTNFSLWFDNAFLFIFFGLWIGAIISSFLIDTNPAFLVINIILLIIVLVIAAYLSNSYGELMSDAEYLVVASDFPVTNYVLNNIVMFVLGIFTTILITLFAKERIL